MFVTNNILVTEIERLRQENARKDEIIVELIDRFVHNRKPGRLIVSTREANGDHETLEGTEQKGIGYSDGDDAYSIAERQAALNADNMARFKQGLPPIDN